VQGALRSAGEAENRIKHIREALIDTPDADPQLLTEADGLKKRLNAILTRLRGDRTLSKRNEPTPLSISARVSQVVSNQRRVTSPPTQTQRDAYQFAGEEFREVLAELRQLIEKDLTQLEGKLEAAGAPWTPGRVPTWQME
jgi:hypothetical protein